MNMQRNEGVKERRRKATLFTMLIYTRDNPHFTANHILLFLRPLSPLPLSSHDYFCTILQHFTTCIHNFILFYLTRFTACHLPVSHLALRFALFTAIHHLILPNYLHSVLKFKASSDTPSTHIYSINSSLYTCSNLPLTTFKLTVLPPCVTP